MKPPLPFNRYTVVETQEKVAEMLENAVSGDIISVHLMNREAPLTFKYVAKDEGRTMLLVIGVTEDHRTVNLRLPFHKGKAVRAVVSHTHNS